jgi:enoyl-CoA hydratase / 3-hydroxyacyl-CoA dehydrogenase
VAVRQAWLQLPEITLGIVPGLGAMVVPYRRWPAAANLFHDMMRRNVRVSAEAAHGCGIIDAVADDYAVMIESAVACVHRLAGGLKAPADGAVAIALPEPIEPLADNGQWLSAEVMRLLDGAIRDAAAAPNFSAALEIGYRAFGASACTAAAREGIDAFLARRPADFKKTG